jgi:hypothetical protein
MAQFIKIYEDKPNEAAIAKVVKVLKDGGYFQRIQFTVWVVILQILKALGELLRLRGKVREANFHLSVMI